MVVQGVNPLAIDLGPVGADERRDLRAIWVLAMPQSFGCLHFHLIFSTKHRAPLLVGDVCQRLYAYIGGILRDEKGAYWLRVGCRTMCTCWSRSGVSLRCRTRFDRSREVRQVGSVIHFLTSARSPGRLATRHSR